MNNLKQTQIILLLALGLISCEGTARFQTSPGDSGATGMTGFGVVNSGSGTVKYVRHECTKIWLPGEDNKGYLVHVLLCKETQEILAQIQLHLIGNTEGWTVVVTEKMQGRYLSLQAAKNRAEFVIADQKLGTYDSREKR